MTRLEFISYATILALRSGKMSAGEAADVLELCHAAISQLPEPEDDSNLNKAHQRVHRKWPVVRP